MMQVAKGARPSRRHVLAGLAAVAALPVEAAVPAVRIVRRAAAFDRMVAPGARAEVIATGIQWAEGPLWVPREGGYLLFSDPPANIVRRWQRGRGVTTFLSPSGLANPDRQKVREPGANGLALDGRGRLLIANSGGRSIDRLDLATMRRETIVARYEGKRFNSPNDMHVARDGAIWFTDPPYGLMGEGESPLREQPECGVYRWRADGGTMLIDGTLTRPNGVALSPDERRLYVAVSDRADPRVMVYELDRAGMPTASRVLVSAGAAHRAGAPGMTDGMKVARDGTLVCSMPGGITFLTPEGEPVGQIETGVAAANVAFGEGGRALFVTASTRVLRVPLRPGWQG